uniref:Uncharacterized protein n=1 Tax=Florenciella parvula TaxID=236787 RepID=A0A7S2CJ99_9STRA|mmetsp:Transcript_29780/g.61038  ORF Transcript_29780/g.61038 Transcript_29780/m.61038 type:complete len:140 (+) Transcript_29780:3-422(+)
MAEAAEAKGGGLLSTGTIVVNIRGAAGKLELTRRLMGERLAVDGGAGGRKACVFVGDSVTDFRSMVESDIGVLMGGSKSVHAVAQLVGVEVHPLPSSVDALWRADEEAREQAEEEGRAPPRRIFAGEWPQLGALLDSMR